MLSDIWLNINFWNEYGEFCNHIDDKWINEENGDKKAIENELKKVNRVTIETGRDMSEEDWLDVAKKAKTVLGITTVLDISIRKRLLGGARIVMQGNMVDNTVINRYRKWRGYE